MAASLVQSNFHLSFAPRVGVEQGAYHLASAEKVESLFSNGIATCLGLMVSGYNQKGQLGIGLCHYSSGENKMLATFLNTFKAHYGSHIRSILVGGYSSPEEDPDSGSEEDVEDVQACFRKCNFPLPQVIFNPTGREMDDEDVGNDYLNMQVDRFGNFWVQNCAKNSLWQKV